MTAPTDDQLVASYRAGEEAAADELVRRHAEPLARYLFTCGAPQPDVEDLVQEAFFRAFRSLASWRGEASFRAWLFRIGVNLNRDHYRREKNRRLVPLDDVDLVHGDDASAEVDARDLEGRLLAGLEKLPRLQREVFLLRVQQGLDYAEISLALDTTPGSARVHYHHAVRRLKDLVQ